LQVILVRVAILTEPGKIDDNSDVSRKDLSKKDYSGWKLNNVFARFTDFRFCDFSNAKINSFIAPGADFRGANFEGTTIDGPLVLSGAKITEKQVLPLATAIRQEHCDYSFARTLLDAYGISICRDGEYANGPSSPEALALWEREYRRGAGKSA
jgi:hypothetical protein